MCLLYAKGIWGRTIFLVLYHVIYTATSSPATALCIFVPFKHPRSSCDNTLGTQRVCTTVQSRSTLDLALAPAAPRGR